MMHRYAYFCAKCATTKTSPMQAKRLADVMKVDLWIPDSRVTFDFPKGALACREAIDGCAVVICALPIGRDCAWELGYAVGIGKRVYVLGGPLPEGDWMTKIGLEYVFEVSPGVFHSEEDELSWNGGDEL